MLNYPVNALSEASALLQAIKADKSRLDLVLELQRFLIRRIVHTEQRIRRLKRRQQSVRSKSREKVAREVARARKEHVAALHERQQELSQLLFIWRCYGDGIAFLYQSKYALKHLYYDNEYKVKADAGFMSNGSRMKRGFSREYRILCMGIRHGVPVVLSDVTNVIRHGDVCALGGPDPLPIEVKTSTSRNNRTDRQDAQRASLIEFFANDGAPTFRGLQNVRREALTSKEVNHEDVINACISDALSNGWSTMSPEPGITYVAATRTNSEEAGKLGTRSTLLVSLTPEPTYVPHYPFTLSLTPANCEAFIRRVVHVFVLIDLAEVKAAFSRHGVFATMLMDGVSAVQITKSPHDLLQGVQRVSEHYFMRLATEFLSIRWFAEEFSKILDMPPQSLTLEEVATLPGVIDKMPPGWEGLVDCYELPDGSVNS